MGRFIVALLAALVGLAGCSQGDATRGEAVEADSIRAFANFAEGTQANKLGGDKPLVTGPIVFAKDYGWQVAIQINYGPGKRCGGVLINRSYVLTAAHCLDGADADDFEQIIAIGRNDIVVYFGGDEFDAGVKLALDRNWPAQIHPKWKTTDRPFAWDAALLKLDKPITGAVPAPVRSVFFDKDMAVTSGWGDYDASGKPSTYLRAVALPVVSNDECIAELPTDQAANVGQSTLCAVSRTDDACARDSGGPLVIGSINHPQTIGIVSWGPPGDCGVPGGNGKLVGGYTRTSEIAPWIRLLTGDGALTDLKPETLFKIRPRPTSGIIM